MPVYRGLRRGDGRAVVTVDGVALPPRLDLFNHSPTGFEWGYGGSGPAQLALALLAAELGDDGRALRLHQGFKWRMIVRLDRDEPWSLTSAAIRDVAAELEAELAAVEEET